jgi:mannose-6-phosphate isomerase-like protein (cupin superfamily)
VTVSSHGDGRFTVGRAVVTVKVDNDLTAGALALVQWDIPPGTPGPPVHIHHRATETFYVLDGHVAFTRGPDTVDAGAGEALHIPAGLPHTMTNVGPTQARVLELYAPGALLELIREVGGLLGSGRPIPPDELGDVYRKHHSEIVGG